MAAARRASSYAPSSLGCSGGNPSLGYRVGKVLTAVRGRSETAAAGGGRPEAGGVET
jgi:hypothetical protein